MRPGSPRRHLGICLLGVVFLVVFVRHLFLGDLFLLLPFSSCSVSVFGLSCGFSFFFCCYYCTRICRCEDSVYTSVNTNVSISGIALN